ncbi:hypothetical protein HK096_005915 [Nowakowskiella sp. JEL0078]|nr:hypothetical protein HK096_005915 [Nowakowskiella sp. JEL0078]
MKNIVHQKFDWMDDETKEYSFKKVVQIKISNRVSSLQSQNLFISFRETLDNYVNEQLLDLYNPTDRRSWPLHSLSVISTLPHYIPNLNSLFVPWASVLKHRNLPKYFDFSIKGLQIARNSFASILDPGRLYTSEGIHKSWYSASTASEFKDILQCIQDQTGDSKIGQDVIAWTLGLEAAINAWEKEALSVARNKFINKDEVLEIAGRLPALETWQWQKLIYISSAQQMCEVGANNAKELLSFTQTTDKFQSVFTCKKKEKVCF